jgi:DNA-binding CsgD family transcriptional regulator
MFSVVTKDGTILAQSPAVERNRQRLEQSPTTEIIGRKVTEVFSPELAQERMAIIQRCPMHGKSLAFRSVMCGEQYITHVHPLRLQDGSEQRAIIAIHQRVEGDLVSELYTGSEFFEAEYNEYGSLAALSPREVEVLSMLGQGQDTAEIAKALYRSTETIISHKKSLYAKLRCDSHIGAALVARRAGLTRRDAERFTRVSMNAVARRREASQGN